MGKPGKKELNERMEAEKNVISNLQQLPEQCRTFERQNEESFRELRAGLTMALERQTPEDSRSGVGPASGQTKILTTILALQGKIVELTREVQALKGEQASQKGQMAQMGQQFGEMACKFQGQAWEQRREVGSLAEKVLAPRECSAFPWS